LGSAYLAGDRRKRITEIPPNGEDASSAREGGRGKDAVGAYRSWGIEASGPTRGGLVDTHPTFFRKKRGKKEKISTPFFEKRGRPLRWQGLVTLSENRGKGELLLSDGGEPHLNKAHFFF